MKTFGLMVYSALGFETGALALRGIAETQWESLAIVFVVSLFLLEPLNERIRGQMQHGSHSESRVSRGAVVSLVGGLVVLFFVVVHGGIEKWAEEHPAQATVEFVTAIFLVGGVTLAWVRGARHPRRRAALYGFVAAALLEMIPVFLIMILTYGVHVLSYPEPLLGLLLGLGLQGCRAGMIGLIGGLAIDFAKGPRYGSVVALSLLGGSAIDTIIFVSVPALGPWTEDYSDFLASVFGWAAAVWIAPGADQLHRN